MKALKIIGIIVVICAIIGAVVGYFIYNKPHKNYEKAEADFTLTANELYDAFNDNAADAGEMYRDKVVQVTGTVDEISELQDSSTALIFGADNAMMGGINAKLSTDYFSDDEYRQELKKVNSGDQVSVKCRCVGFDQDLISEVKLDNCYIVKK